MIRTTGYSDNAFVLLRKRLYIVGFSKAFDQVEYKYTYLVFLITNKTHLLDVTYSFVYILLSPACFGSFRTKLGEKCTGIYN
jgi:hypothetical protein